MFASATGERRRIRHRRHCDALHLIRRRSAATLAICAPPSAIDALQLRHDDPRQRGRAAAHREGRHDAPAQLPPRAFAAAAGCAAGASTCASASKRAAKAAHERAAGCRTDREIVGAQRVADQVIFRPRGTVLTRSDPERNWPIFAESSSNDSPSTNADRRSPREPALRLHRDRPHDAPHLDYTP